jgi:amino acid adenylation domain-containing protein
MKKPNFLNEYINNLLNNNSFFMADDNGKYNELNNIVNNISYKLYQKYEGKQLSVVILLDRNVYYIASMFAIWRVGSYFIPLNTSWPKERIDTIVEHCDADIVICHKDGGYHSSNALYIENTQFIKNEERIFEDICLKHTDLAYIIYTSGSTGIPKGVMITSNSYISYIEWTKRFFKQYKNNKALLLTAELTFDITMGDIAFSLAFWTSIIISPDPKNMISHIKLINKYNIDTFYSVPTTHNAIFSFAKRKKSIHIDSINLILSGGDSFSVELIKLIKDVLPNGHFYNVYGPTEVTINCFAIRVDNMIESIEDKKLVPIGEPFDIIDATIIDDNNNDITNMNQIGKLFVCGEQVMLGYLDDYDKTDEVFVLDSRYPKFKRKIYNTGDLAIKKEDGLFYLLGRSDDIVKIKGYRINPLEINNELSKLNSIKESIVSALEHNKNYRLVSYITLNNDISIDKIRNYLLERLPDYMVPNDFIIIKQMPLNNSGKIDKKLLKSDYKDNIING